MAEVNYSIDLDLKEVKAMVDHLVPYIYEDDLYGKITLDSARLTPGAILLRLRRLNALRDQMSTAQAAQLDRISATNDKVRQEWAVAYGRKMVREAEARLRDLNTYLKECKDDPRLCANAYLPEALRRTMVAEILDALPAEVDGSALKTSAKSVDSGLRRYVEETDFLWDRTLMPIYPAEAYWWLYNRPPKPE
ncbi:MAG: hypothetical protein J0L63_04350 [Anaerolineae bacterium]|nr:hypothetical protein [Anaerolineae bacterium]